MKFHITITDTETGKVLHEEDTNCIVGGYKTKDGTNSLCIAACSDFDLSSAIVAAEGAVRSVKKQKGPVFAAMTEMLPQILKASKEEMAESEEKTEEGENV